MSIWEVVHGDSELKIPTSDHPEAFWECSVGRFTNPTKAKLGFRGDQFSSLFLVCIIYRFMAIEFVEYMLQNAAENDFPFRFDRNIMLTRR